MEVARWTLEGDINPTGPNRLRVPNVTYVRTLMGFFCVAVVIDALAGSIVSRIVGRSLRTNLVLGALERALFGHDHDRNLARHSDHEARHFAIR